ncbi:MAG: alpha/beta hydrolase [Armatimonadota bacterium]|nr:alpha/beta hydrolase [Armatimonadota bacterium]
MIPYIWKALAVLVIAMALFTKGSEVSAINVLPAFPGTTGDYHGFVLHNFTVSGCDARVVEPKQPLPGRPWIWRAMFWDAFPSADLALLDKGYYLAYIEVGNTFGASDALKNWDPFYKLLTETYGFAKRPALEGVSRGGLYIYRWAASNPMKVGCLYGDAPVCDMKSWPGGKGKGTGSAGDWAEAIRVYHFRDEAEMMAFKGNPVDILASIAAAKIPIIHVVGDSDIDVPPAENTDIVRERYLKLGGTFVLITKQGCAHHPHGLKDTTQLVNFIMAHTAGGKAARAAAKLAPRSGQVIVVPQGEW